MLFKIELYKGCSMKVAEYSKDISEEDCIELMHEMIERLEKLHRERHYAKKKQERED